MAEKAFYTTLKNRGMVRVSGPDTRGFLQGLISNDINLLGSQPLVYACLLSPQGKFLHDFFLFEKGGAVHIDCEGGERAKDLHKKLSMYKLRAKVEIEISENNVVYAGNFKNGWADPRKAGLGSRAYEKPEAPEVDFDVWDTLRINLTIPDGSRDLTINSSTLDEGRIYQLNGVSYEKGCYVGQELTARMHHRGLGKKHLYTVSGELLREPGEEIIVNDKTLGQMRSRCNDVGLALLKDEVA
jgi:tRNA-modifying protein YgfZ